jgi:hypothetical protein
MAYTKYSLTPANNTAAPPDGAPEGMLPSAVNDTMRDMMAQIRDVGDGIRDGTYTMTAPKITGGTITGATVTSNTFSSSGATITGGTINGTTIGATTASTGKFTAVTNSALTSGRVTYAGTSGVLQDDADFTFNGTTVTMANDALISGLTVGKGTGTSTQSTSVGASALSGANTVGYNTAFGYFALKSNTDGANNVSLGNQALQNNTTASQNTAVGSFALTTNTTGANNSALGQNALQGNTTGENNVAFGVSALSSNTTASNNTAVGYQAGYYSTALTTGGQNILIGNYTRTSAATSNYQFVIGYDVAGQADNNVTIGSASGKVYNAFTSNATWTQTSDGRLKKNIQDETLGLSFINRLKPVKYEWKASNELDKDNPYYAEENKRTTGVVMHGLVAQDVKAALDAEGINTFAGWDEGSDGIQSISREMFISPLIKAIQELNAKVEAQALEIATLKGK